jgi:hypothetical protein
MVIRYCLCHKWRRICSICRNHYPVHSSSMTSHRGCSESKAMGATHGTGTAFTPAFSGVRVARHLVFSVMFCRWLFVLLSFFVSLLYCLSSDLPLLITHLVSCGHCIVCPPIYDFWLPIWYLVVIVLSVLRSTTSDYPFGILWSLYCLSSDLPLLITHLVSSSFSACITHSTNIRMNAEMFILELMHNINVRVNASYSFVSQCILFNIKKINCISYKVNALHSFMC